MFELNLVEPNTDLFTQLPSESPGKFLLPDINSFAEKNSIKFLFFKLDPLFRETIEKTIAQQSWSL